MLHWVLLLPNFPGLVLGSAFDIGGLQRSRITGDLGIVLLAALLIAGCAMNKCISPGLECG